MVIEFVALSSKKEDDMNGNDVVYDGNARKALESESSDEDTTSSSLLPIPNILDEMRNELKSTLNGFCDTDFESEEPKVNGFKHPTDMEMSIASKITTANLLLDDLLNNTDILPKERNPVVFSTKTNRSRGKNTDSETVTDQESSSSTERCHTIPVTPFIFPAPVCECSRCPCERKETTNKETEQSEKIIQQPEISKFRRRFPLYEKMKLMRLKCRKKKKNRLVQQTQTEPPPENHPSFSRPFQRFTVDEEKSTIPENPSPVLECNCSPVIKPTFRECYCDSQKEIEVPEYNRVSEAETGHQQNGNNTVPEITDKPVTEQPPRDTISDPPIPATTANHKARERIDIYYFDHGNSAYYQTTDSHPAKFTEYLIERTDEYATKFWAEVFGTITIAIAFIISFILQLYRCLFTAIIRALTVGLIQIFSDYFFKPLLTVIFNGLIQPCLILGYNVATSTKDFCVPICEIFQFCANDLSIIFRSCRIVEINQKTCSPPSCACIHKV